MTDLEKPNGVSLGWERLETTYPFDYHMFRVRKDLVRWPDGRIAPYAYVEGMSAVWVVPITVEGKVVLIRQFRYTLDDWCWEVPAGGSHDFDGSPMALAKRELAEEVGGKSEAWRYVGCFRPGTSIMNAVYHIVMAEDVQLALRPQREASEIIEVHEVPPEEAVAMARSGEMVDGYSALALLRCEPHILSSPSGG